VIRCSLEMELWIPPKEELPAPKEEPQELAKKPKI